MIKKNNVEFSSLSMMDDFGRVFFRNGKVFRAIQNDRVDYCTDLINSTMFQELMNKGLLPKTSISDFKLEGHELILEHEKLLVILQHEWSFDMLKDAALAVLEINKICNKHGYELKDAHTLNMLFRGTKPVLADIGSISKMENREIDVWPAYEEFLGSFIIPLLFWEKKMNYITRKLLESNFHRIFTIPAQTIAESGLLKLLTENKNEYQFKLRSFTITTQTEKSAFLNKLAFKTQSVLKSITGRNTQVFSYKNIAKEYTSLSDYFPANEIQVIIGNTKSPKQDSTWQGYHQKYYFKDNEPEYSPRFLRILELIKSEEIEINSIIDLAGNEGYFCKLINDRTDIKKIILVDYDENALNDAYLNFRKENNRVHTALLNFMFTPNIEGTAKRLKSDLAIALAVTHHLILSSNFSIDCIFERIKSFSNKYVLVEFMPLGLWATGDEIYPVLPDWYHVDWFRREFGNHFDLIHVEQLEQNRILFFGIIPQ